MKRTAFLTLAASMLHAQPPSASQITLRVSAQSNPYLAGMPDGARAPGGDRTPRQSPATVSLSLAGAVSGSFTATGGVSHWSGGITVKGADQFGRTRLEELPLGCPPTCSSPDGAADPRSDFHGKRWWWEPQFVGHDDGNKNGISNVIAPYDSLIGVFLEDGQPDRFKAPKLLDFKRLGLNFTSLAPELRQVFFIGTGATKDGVTRRYLVPKGAARLYLGIMDSIQWSNNSGSFMVTVNVERAETSSQISSTDSDISYAKWACLPNRSQCTPEKEIVEARDAGEYHIVLPAQLEWGASIPTPPGTSVALRGVTGMVCLGFQGRGSDRSPESCHGSLGDGKPAGEAYLVPDEAAGALVTKTADGRTYFSVNGRSGASFQAHEGYFEFDATVR
ncbi:MAG: hypothetical protein ACLPWF_05870 [Bryobacteraceae bacterium]